MTSLLSRPSLFSQVRAGILEDGIVTVDDRGTGQGSVTRPLRRTTRQFLWRCFSDLSELTTFMPLSLGTATAGDGAKGGLIGRSNIKRHFPHF
jgi:hypothetical protein